MDNKQQNNHDDVEPSHSLSDIDNQENDFEDGFGALLNSQTDQSSLIQNMPIPSTNQSET